MLSVMLAEMLISSLKLKIIIVHFPLFLKGSSTAEMELKEKDNTCCNKNEKYYIKNESNMTLKSSVDGEFSNLL